jgi:hypothetical protein
VHKVNDVRQIELHSSEQLVPLASPFEVKVGIANSKRCKSPGINTILAELLQVKLP